MNNRKKKIQEINNLYNMWKTGKLGGEVMPEDANPNLDINSKENYSRILSPAYQCPRVIATAQW